jgi:hypothetical protein
MNTNKTARTAGIIYIIMDICLVFSGLIVDPKIYVPGDTVATVTNILTFEWLYRLSFVSNLIGIILNLFLVLALYELFRSVNKRQARLMVILVVAGVAVAFLNNLNKYVPILLLNNTGHLSGFNQSQLQSLAIVFLDFFNHGVILTEIFWGLWLIPLGLLVCKSGFIPKVMGFLLFVGCVGQLTDFFSVFLFPNYSAILTPIAEMAMIGELFFFVWLLIKGIKTQQPTITEEV